MPDINLCLSLLSEYYPDTYAGDDDLMIGVGSEEDEEPEDVRAMLSFVLWDFVHSSIDDDDDAKCVFGVVSFLFHRVSYVIYSVLFVITLCVRSTHEQEEGMDNTRNQKSKLSRFDFETAEEWEKYQSTREATPK